MAASTSRTTPAGTRWTGLMTAPRAPTAPADRIREARAQRRPAGPPQADRPESGPLVRLLVRLCCRRAIAGMVSRAVLRAGRARAGPGRGGWRGSDERSVGEECRVRG